MKTVTLSKGGTAETRVPLSALEIPDLWHLALRQDNDLDKASILDTWHLAHDLRRELWEGCEVIAELRDKLQELEERALSEWADQYLAGKLPGVKP